MNGEHNVRDDGRRDTPPSPQSKAQASPPTRSPPRAWQVGAKRPPPDASKPTRLQTFLPGSKPRTEILLPIALPENPRAYIAGRRGGHSKGLKKPPHRSGSVGPKRILQNNLKTAAGTQRMGDIYPASQQRAAANGAARVGEPASRSGTANGRVPSLRVIKVTNNVASLGCLECVGRAAIRGRWAGVSRRVPVPFNSHWRRARWRASDRLLGGGWSGGYDGANRCHRQECQD
jgi:hypothetical protein